MFEMSDMKKEVGERLRAARERKGFKQNRVAKHLGIHNSTLAKYESGEREADGETLRNMAEHYDVSIDWLMGNDRPSTREQAKSKVMESYSKLSQEKKKLIDDMIKALEGE
jgi:transcriptional regulator with XRE-family HTH domain